MTQRDERAAAPIDTLLDAAKNEMKCDLDTADVNPEWQLSLSLTVAEVRALRDAFVPLTQAEIDRVTADVRQIEAALAVYARLKAHSDARAALRAPRAGGGAVAAVDGLRPESNRAQVEVVSTSDLLPGNVVWDDDGWYVVLDWDQADSTQVCAAPIIDDAGGQGESTILYGEWFLRVVTPAAVGRTEGRGESKSSAQPSTGAHEGGSNG